MRLPQALTPSVQPLDDFLSRNRGSKRQVWSTFGDFLRKTRKESVSRNQGLASADVDDFVHWPHFVGFSGHKNPDYHLAILAKAYAWDAIQLPLDVLDPHFRSFERRVLPEAVKRQLGIIGMKPMAFQNAPKTEVITSIECLHYAMSLPVSVTITGCETMERLETALQAVRTFKPLGESAMQALRDRMQPFVKKGESEPYKITTDFDNKPAAFPPPYEA